MSEASMSEQRTIGLRGGRILVTTLFVVVSFILVGRFLSNLFVEVLWFRATGFSSVFWISTLWQWGVRALVTGVAATLVLVNLRYVVGTLGVIQIKRRLGDLEINEQLPRSYVIWGMTGAAVLLGLWFGAALPPGAGTQILVALRAEEWGILDPILGRDLGYYVFMLPVLRGILVIALVLCVMLLGMCALGYTATGAVRWEKGRVDLDPAPRMHLTVLLASLLLLLAGNFWLGRYFLLLDGTSSVEGIFGFTDARARLPALRSLAVISVLMAGVVVWGGVRRKAVFSLVAVTALIVSGVLLGEAYPSVIQRFRVAPNELERETVYIEHALEFTRLGFGLDHLERRDFEYEPPTNVNWDEAAQQFAGLPVWTQSALLTSFREIEARFRYYDFGAVTIDRYPGPDGRAMPVALSVREVDPAGIEDPNWQNLHIRSRYLQGMGVVAATAVRATPQGRPEMFLSGIPPVFTAAQGAPQALNLTQPVVYFGARSQLYAILNEGEITGERPDGIQLSSTLRTLALAWRFRDADLLFSSEVTSSSRFVFRRQVQERVQAIAPFLQFSEAPYPIITEGRVIWMIDGFTGTRHFPLSSPRELRRRLPLNYVRNSVKITVDGVTGETRFYVVDDQDPIVDAFRRAFPDLFLDLEDMPEEVRSHLRYPRSLLTLQAAVLLQYHQETAPVFHGRQDVWAFSQELAQGTQPVAYQPEYGIYRLPGDVESSFLLSTVFVPAGRQNLTALLVARNDAERYGDLVLLNVPVEDQVPGPRQVEALIEQDPIISQQFSLWRQGGSQVWSGHLHLVPVGQTLLYMEPIFLAAEVDAIPELRRFVVSDGRRVSMMPTLEGAIRELAQMGGAPRPALSANVGEAALNIPTSEWPAEALDLLDQAETHLRAGEWQAFGDALARLRTLLNDLSAEGAGQ